MASLMPGPGARSTAGKGSHQSAVTLLAGRILSWCALWWVLGPETRLVGVLLAIRSRPTLGVLGILSAILVLRWVAGRTLGVLRRRALVTSILLLWRILLLAIRLLLILLLMVLLVAVVGRSRTLLWWRIALVVALVVTLVLRGIPAATLLVAVAAWWILCHCSSWWFIRD